MPTRNIALIMSTVLTSMNALMVPILAMKMLIVLIQLETLRANAIMVSKVSKIRCVQLLS